MNMIMKIRNSNFWLLFTVQKKTRDEVVVEMINPKHFSVMDLYSLFFSQLTEDMKDWCIIL